MKRTLPLLGVVFTTAVALSGCGLGGTVSSDTTSTAQIPELKPEQQVSITFESYNYGLAGAWTDTFNALIADFGKKYPNIKVTAQKPQGNSPNPATDTISSIQNQMVAGTPPDVAQLGFSDLDFTINQLQAKPLDTLVGKQEVARNFDGRHAYAPRARVLDDWNGHTYGVPFVFSTPVLYLNASLFAEAGLDPAKPPATWAEVATAAKQIADRTGKGGVYIDCLTKTAKDWCFQSMVRSNGGRVISQDRRTLTYADAPAVEVTQMAQNLVNSGSMPKLNQKQGYEAFARGEIGMILETSAIQGTFVTGAKDKWDLRSAAMPAFGDKPTVPTNSGAGLHILSNDPAKQRAAWELIKFLTSEESYIKIAQNIGYLPLRTGLLDQPDGLKDWAAKNPLLKPNVAQLGTMEPWVSMPGNNYLQMRDGMMDAVEAIVFQGKDPQSTLTAAQAEGAKLIPAA
ncbi:ABC transporter substrate-binding protein [Nocardia neocaledoniensis NBRC 108232]|uniref:Carbohydrate ABC transporter substrate-binding protein (CUT1 family) n=1 Tax=Nocardia neocaledoniensis TaxID=236511 RepID=A0A317NZH8_9NOCA|nr:ABC transporter substrate-binding protein [Nocardia neocaledoniensis]PWV80729.1 carbohydrate ABC transporter substrate-binding protein (CUT1 family) [Nocardia neocaledoniensis]GEM32207.1 ABC transporter substrate-binding protein [Nocardia neocaledoniensis NBRC 108232]